MKVVCFDLDDTLYKEIDYLHSAYRDIAQKLWNDDWQVRYNQMLQWRDEGTDVFDHICEVRPDIEKGRLLNMYRYDPHEIKLSPEVETTLQLMKSAGIKLGLITDGRVQTQENKIRTLGLYHFFDKDMIVISESFGTEKPSLRNYQYFMDKFPDCKDFTYIADNPSKDFLAPNQLGWNTICLLDNGLNIHKQDYDLAVEYLPKIKISTIQDIISAIQNNTNYKNITCFKE